MNLIRGGAEDRFVPDRETGQVTHTMAPVYCMMLRQIARDYPGLPDARTLTLSEIRFFYDGLRAELKVVTKPK